jgi:hypothetical protein
MSEVHVHAIPAFTDNYIWMMHDGRNAVVVDPGEAEPVERTLAQMGLSLCAIVLTHCTTTTAGVSRVCSSPGRCLCMGRFSTTTTAQRIRHFQNPALYLWIVSRIRSPPVTAWSCTFCIRA